MFTPAQNAVEFRAMNRTGFGGLQIGDRVEFTCRGRKYTGTVANLRWIQRRGKTRQLAYAVTGDDGSLDREAVEIAPDNGRGVYTVGPAACKKIGTGDREAAVAAVREVKGANTARKANRKHQQVEAAIDNNLHSLKPGDPIRIKFRQGTFTRYFVAFTSSGTIRFADYVGATRTRTTPATFVSLPETA